MVTWAWLGFGHLVGLRNAFIVHIIVSMFCSVETWRLYESCKYPCIHCLFVLSKIRRTARLVIGCGLNIIWQNCYGIIQILCNFTVKGWNQILLLLLFKSYFCVALILPTFSYTWLSVSNLDEVFLVVTKMKEQHRDMTNYHEPSHIPDLGQASHTEHNNKCD